MSAIVTLNIYSGVPNPTWELSDSQVAELKRRLGEAKVPTDLTSPASAGRLGYSGFQLYTVGDLSLPNSAHIFDGVLDLKDALSQNYVDADSALERFLLETAGNALTSEQREYVAAEIEKNVTGGIANTFKNFQVMAVPPFDAGKWNNDRNIRTHNNCYNYGNDKITNTFAQPGLGSGQIGSFPPDCDGTGAAAQRDGQIPVSSADAPPAQGQFIALVIWPGNDYHWYRLDSNNQWSHKPGPRPARNTDNSGRLISDPQNCNRGPYTIFCSFYHCIPSQTRIK
jgi:hypothetical protein